MTRRRFSHLTLTLAALATFATLSGAGADVNFGTRHAPPKDFVAVLSRPVPEVENRGMKLGQVAPDVPSVSLEIRFAFNSDKVPASAMDTLNNLAVAMRDRSLENRRFKVIGHTDAAGSHSYNIKLSQRRAASVRAYLIQKGITEERLRPIGVGKSYPLNPQHPEAPENRRVQIAVDV